MPDTPQSTVPSELNQLRDALDKLKLVLDETVNSADALTTHDLTPQLRAAWPEIVAAFQGVDHQLAEGNLSSQLMAVGLAGPSLHLKLAGFRRAFSRLWRAGKERLRKATGSLLQWGNTILGSLISVVPAAEIIKEFKECVENDLAEQEEVTQGGQEADSPQPPAPSAPDAVSRAR